MHASLELMRREPAQRFASATVGHIRTRPIRLLIRIAMNRRRERNVIAQLPPRILDRHAPLLPQDIEARNLQRRQHLRAMVVERRGLAMRNCISSMRTDRG